LQIYGLKDKITTFVCSGDLEVQERSSSALVLLECLKENPGLAQELIETFEGELNPVAPKAQRKVDIYLIIAFVTLFLYYLLHLYYLFNSIFSPHTLGERIYMLIKITHFYKNFTLFCRFRYLRI
jgi:hypothetical protein